MKIITCITEVAHFHAANLVEGHSYLGKNEYGFEHSSLDDKRQIIIYFASKYNSLKNNGEVMFAAKIILEFTIENNITKNDLHRLSDIIHEALSKSLDSELIKVTDITVDYSFTAKEDVYNYLSSLLQ